MPNPLEPQQIFETAVSQLQARRQAMEVAKITDTPICRDMRRTAKDIGIVDLLLEHQRIAPPTADGRAYSLVEQALILFGVTSEELLANLSQAGLTLTNTKGGD